jgi:predicted DNA-binding protein
MINELTISKSFRLPKADVNWVDTTAKLRGITQTQMIKECIQTYKMNEGKSFVDNIQVTMKDGGITNTDDEVMQTLSHLGIATASGFAGYYISGIIREQFEMDEDKGMQLLLGMISGLGVLFLQALHSKK